MEALPLGDASLPIWEARRGWQGHVPLVGRHRERGRASGGCNHAAAPDGGESWLDTHG